MFVRVGGCDTDGWNDIQLFDEHSKWWYTSNYGGFNWEEDTEDEEYHEACIEMFSKNKNFKEVPVWD